MTLPQPPETTAHYTATDSATPETRKTTAEIVPYIAGTLSHLSTGELARLRRGPLRAGEAGAPAFWRLKSQCNFPDNKLERWAAIIQAMALLTKRKPSGAGKDDAPHVSPHDPSYHLGKALCDGGDANWPADPQTARPLLSELRLARLLNAKGETRRDLILRAIRMLARSDTRLNCIELARLILKDDDHVLIRTIAKAYYNRLTRAEGKAKNETKDKAL